jgi:hypothetical protein
MANYMYITNPERCRWAPVAKFIVGTDPIYGVIFYPRTRVDASEYAKLCVDMFDLVYARVHNNPSYKFMLI